MNKSKRKLSLILSIIVALLVTLIAVIILVFGDKISFAWNTYNAYSEKKEMSSEELQSAQESNDDKAREILNELTTTEIHDLTDEEKEALAKGELSEEEALKIILGEDADSTDSADSTESAEDTKQSKTQTSETKQNTDNSHNGQKETKKAEETTEKVLDKEQISKMKDVIIAKIYILRASSINSLEALINDKIAEYKALPLEEHGTLKKAEYAKVLLDEGNKLESECNAELEALLDELKALLAMEGNDFSVIDEIRATYEEQKQLKKAEILKQYIK